MIGAVLGSYRILAQIGAGGMGVVYVGEHVTLGRRAAIKVLLPELSRNREMISRIFTEARAAALIDHPGMCGVYDFGQLPDGSAFIVMELLEGESLAALLDHEGRLSVDMAVALGRQIASAVGAAHAKGIIHRDLKPDNVFLVRDQEIAGGLRVKVLDFGIAKLSADEHHSVRTQTGALMGTPAYMSPEQCRGAGTVDWRADIYSVGCILFEMLTGRPPFTHDGMGEVIAAHMYHAPPRPSEINPTVPEWVETVVLRTLAKRPEDRQQSMDALAAHLGGARISVRPAPTLSAQRSFPIISVSPTPTALGPSRPRRRGVIVGLLASAVIAAATFAVFRTQKGAAPPEPAPVAAAPPPAVPVSDPTPAPAPALTPAPAPVELPATVSLVITSVPPGADVYRAVDGIKVGVTPLTHSLPRTPGSAVFIVQLEGHREQRVEMPVDHDSSVDLTLVKLPGRTSRPTPARRARSADSPMDPF